MTNRFTIHQVCKCCGVSRSTILRMEDRGLLQPAFVDEKTGYRYYNTYNVTRVLHIKMFLEMGLSYGEVALYFQSDGKAPQLLDALRARLSALKRTYDEMELRINDRQNFSAEFIRLPEYVCYQKEFKASAPDGRYKSSYDTFREMVEKGYRPLISKYIFLINKRDDLWESGDPINDAGNDFICCIPLQPDCADEHTVTYPSCTAFSLLCYGDYAAIQKAHTELGKRVRALGLKSTGYPRSIGIVSGYTDGGFDKKNYVTRLAVPLEDMSDEEIVRRNKQLFEHIW